ncbi:MAG: phosphotransferase [Pyrinomonadaceae bacterium]|nr:phosphotransferase [Pyrinomonadaceae bacterium]
MPRKFETSAFERLQTFLENNNALTEAERLTPDASTREFFRIRFHDQTAIACVYEETFDEGLPQLDVTDLFLKSDLPVAKIFAVHYDCGLVVHEDFGDRILGDTLRQSDTSVRNDLINQAISIIAQIQAATPRAFEIDSIASRLKFDHEKLLWELNFFKTHYFVSLRKTPLSDKMDFALTKEFVELSEELERHATVLTHRDFHAANLMLDSNGSMKIIDHQDARIGSVAYDLVSLLLDRITEPPSQESLRDKKIFFLAEREKLGLGKIEPEDFDYEFDLMTVQRCLKAIGTFSNQAANFDKIQYLPYINPMFQVVLEACKRLGKYQTLQNIVEEQLGE